MKDFFDKVLHSVGMYKIESILLGSALLIGLLAAIIFIRSVPGSTATESISFHTATPSMPLSRTPQIIIHIAGALVKPGVYTLPTGARINDALKAAGGLNPDADIAYFDRTFNLAQKLTDEEKLYIPTVLDIQLGFESTTPPLSFASPAPSPLEFIPTDLNTASQVELDALPGVGPATAIKIIDARPYSSADDLLTKNVVKQAAFDKIKDLITAL